MLKCYSLISFVQNKESNIKIIHGCNCYTDDYVYCLLLNNYYWFIVAIVSATRLIAPEIPHAASHMTKSSYMCWVYTMYTIWKPPLGFSWSMEFGRGSLLIVWAVLGCWLHVIADIFKVYTLYWFSISNEYYINKQS